MHVRHPATILLALALALYATSANAQDSRGAELFRKGRAAAVAGNDVAACAYFEQSYALERARGTLFNLAFCHERIGRIASASREYALLLPRLPQEDPRYSHTVTALAELELRLPRLTIRIAPGAPNETRVSMDDRAIPAGELDTPQPADPGRHVIVVRSANHTSRTYVVTLDERQLEQILVKPGDRLQPATNPLRASAKTPPSSPKAEPRSSNSTLGLVLLGIGGAGLVTSGVAAWQVLDRKQTVEDECFDAGGEQLCSPKGNSAAKSGQTWAVVGTVAFALGLGSAGAGTYFLLTANRSQRSGALAVVSAF